MRTWRKNMKKCVDINCAAYPYPSKLGLTGNAILLIITINQLSYSLYHILMTEASSHTKKCKKSANWNPFNWCAVCWLPDMERLLKKMRRQNKIEDIYHFFRMTNSLASVEIVLFFVRSKEGTQTFKPKKYIKIRFFTGMKIYTTKTTK